VPQSPFLGQNDARDGISTTKEFGEASTLAHCGITDIKSKTPDVGKPTTVINSEKSRCVMLDKAAKINKLKKK
jgi:hypothetical protein